MVCKAEYISLPVERIFSAGSIKPWTPVSRNSTVYEYLMPATPFAQSSEPPEAKSNNYLKKEIISKTFISPRLTQID